MLFRSHYVPTPPHRVAHITHRLQSQKQPVECPEDCVCVAEELGEGRWFCRFTLASGWETECPNRARKVECSHSDRERQRRCRNSEIKKQLRKQCVGKKSSGEERPEQIEEKKKIAEIKSREKDTYEKAFDIDTELAERYINAVRDIAKELGA